MFDSLLLIASAAWPEMRDSQRNVLRAQKFVKFWSVSIIQPKYSQTLKASQANFGANLYQLKTVATISLFTIF
jgi:hypothetical protein